jgi:hypothetical protein
MTKSNNSESFSSFLGAILILTVIIICFVNLSRKINFYQERYKQCRQAEGELINENYKLRSELSFYKRQIEEIDSTVWGHIYRQEVSFKLK